MAGNNYTLRSKLLVLAMRRSKLLVFGYEAFARKVEKAKSRKQSRESKIKNDRY